MDDFSFRRFIGETLKTEQVLGGFTIPQCADKIVSICSFVRGYLLHEVTNGYMDTSDPTGKCATRSNPTSQPTIYWPPRGWSNTVAYTREYTRESINDNNEYSHDHSRTFAPEVWLSCCCLVGASLEGALSWANAKRKRCQRVLTVYCRDFALCSSRVQ